VKPILGVRIEQLDEKRKTIERMLNKRIAAMDEALDDLKKLDAQVNEFEESGEESQEEKDQVWDALAKVKERIEKLKDGDPKHKDEDLHEAIHYLKAHPSRSYLFKRVNRWCSSILWYAEKRKHWKGPKK
jgi:chromosome segregation ATPase